MCYNIFEVSIMDEQQQNSTPEEEVQTEQTGYIPRPKWQVWLARIGLVLFILMLILYYINIMRGGL